MDLSILIPTYNEEANIGKLVKDIKKIVNQLKCTYEILVMDGLSTDDTRKNAKKTGAKVFIRSSMNFKTFLTDGIKKAKGKYILTLDADFTHSPTYIRNLWNARKDADLIICSRWVKHGRADMSFFRRSLSYTFNLVYRILLGIKTKDNNSNFRLYRREILENVKLKGESSSILPEIVFYAQRSGYKIKEIPFFYMPRKYGKSKLKLMNDGKLYLRTLLELWKVKMFNRV